MDSNPWFTLHILYLCLCVMSYLSHGADRISANQSVSGNKTIVSSGGIFSVGFFKPGNSQNYYIGIWYSVSKETIVWVANREKPVTNINSSELRISDGNLVLFNQLKIPVWSTNLSSSTTSSNSSIEAVLHDKGNLVLRDRSSLSESLWQSFDHPTDTLLPDAKLGLNKITGERTRLISWKNKEDPAPGLFSFVLDPNGTSQLVILSNSQRYWATGPWNGQMFIFVPELRINHIFNVSYVDNYNESYFTFFVYNSPIMARIVMNVVGQVQVLSWLEPARWSVFWYRPKLQCEVYGHCGAFGICTEKPKSSCNCLPGFEPKFVQEWNLDIYSNGCLRKTSLQCLNSRSANGNRDTFLENHYQVVPDFSQIMPVESAQHCESICSKNCSCTAYAYDNNACSIWFGDLLNLQIPVVKNGGHTMYLRLASAEIPQSHENKGKLIGYVAGSGVALAVIVIALFIIFRRNKANKKRKAEEGLLVVFSYKDLQNATKNFSDKVGEGGFGSVYKGKLYDSSVIAVKKLKTMISQEDKQFRIEVNTAGTIQHANLVRLRGFCSEGNRKLLVYDYMPNGSLDTYLFKRNNMIVLDWKTRYKIALGTAKGLAYLHEKCIDCIIHCDIKPENILLDEEFCPKVTDFGMAKLFERDFSRVLTTMRGTIGYLAPEWISGEAITAKVDVYSYGLMLLELISGRRNSEQPNHGNIEYFPLQVANLINKDGDVLSLLDPRLEGNTVVEEVTRLCKVACWCIQENETERPSMGQVVYFLEGVLVMDLPPIPKFLQNLSWNPGVVSW